ncbi:nucleoside deaminase [Corynebacterium meridianum]|uniref:tRNA-specific adenosine deaminase n=1 Tax=Corynebacterium meridianum TaxID=2765363 RepID=A0A934M586_9CORY|nr:nucleoside deaminase [Corynebacterium meridianum]MBI8989856.1 nucleoside deaminase [Corynebacterium meridianum]MCK7677731.1 nucleoside deaminase [Corynebacterium meridianum]
MPVLPDPEWLFRAETLMLRAIEVARTTPPGDVPVGAVVIDSSGRELAVATNRRETDSDPTAHAEILAIRRAAARHGDGWRLTGCTLVVTLEPCTMCAGALLDARIGEVIFGAYEPKTGACGSVHDVLRPPGAVRWPEVRGGVLGGRCAELMTGFFGTIR